MEPQPYVSFYFRMIKTAAHKKKWEFVKQAIETTVSKTIEEIPKQKQYRLWNKEVKDLSEKQKDLRIQIQNCKQEEKIKELKKERNYDKSLDTD